MRPTTLDEAVRRVLAGEPQDMMLAEFVDTFLLASDNKARADALAAEPMLTEDARLNALVGAMAEYLSKQAALDVVPAWTSASSRRLDQPWFTTSSDAPGMREYLSYASPAEFRSRNIFTEERPLRRARGGFASAGAPNSRAAS